MAITIQCNIMLNIIMVDRLNIAQILGLRDKAKSTLDKLIVDNHIYASEYNGWAGAYHSWFGRDSAIVTDLVCASVEYGGDNDLACRALGGLSRFAQWQGSKDSILTGESLGKLPHEIRNTFNQVDHIQHAAGTNQLPWFVDPLDGLLKNWDSADSTALWAISMTRAHNITGTDYSSNELLSLRAAANWIMKNLNDFDGLAGFLGADCQVGRTFSGLHNQGWKDTEAIYQSVDGSPAVHPIKDVLVNAESWAALKELAVLFRDDDELSSKLSRMSDVLRVKFNSSSDGFLLENGEYYAQAIDGLGRQLPQRAIDVGMCLWASNDGECVIEATNIDRVVEYIMSSDMFNPTAGIRNYALGTVFSGGTNYHGSPHTYWPFASTMVARGLECMGYHDEAIRVSTAVLQAISCLGSNIEMFTEELDGRLSPWHHPLLNQQSATEQAWTAAAIYYNCSFLLADELS